MTAAPPVHRDFAHAEDLAIAREVIEREAMLLEEQRWDEWIELYSADCVYWVPSWGRDGKLGTDPRRALSLIFYPSRAGLEDRIVRLRSGKSPAGRPPLRTAHLVSNIRVLDSNHCQRMIEARASFANHVFFPRQESSSVYFGHSRFTLRGEGADWKIARKEIVLQNDYIATYLDICCL